MNISLLLKKQPAPLDQTDPDMGRPTVEDYLHNAAFSLEMTLQQLQYAAEWLRKYKADTLEVDVLIASIKMHIQDINRIKQEYE